MSHPIGIDLGTTYSAIAKWVSKTNFTGSEAYHIPSEGSHTLPSIAFIQVDDDTGERDFVFGRTARGQGTSLPDQFIKAVKRKMDDADYRYDVLGETYSPIDISAEVLKHLLFIAEGVEGPGTYVPGGIVVSVPYYFKQHQNLNTKNAALKAINDLYGKRSSQTPLADLFLGLIAEPVAAGLYYAFDQYSGSGEENVMVFDLGGGTFDLTIFSLKQEGTKIEFEVVAVEGDDRLGGEDFDNSFFLWMCDQESIDLSKLDEKTKGRALKKIQPALMDAKHTLSGAKRTDITIPNAVGAAHVEIDPVKRNDFEDCITGKAGDKRDYHGEIDFKLDRVLQKANMSPDDITCVLSVGGSSQILKFKDLITDKFGSTKLKDAGDINLAVAKGATIYAAYLLDDRLEASGQPRKHLSKWDKIEIGIVTPHQLGIDLNGKFHRIINDNILTPYSRTEIFEPTQLSDDGEKAILEKLVVLQGEPKDNSKVGEIELEDIHTHGRSLTNISIKITFTAVDSSLINIRIFVKEGNADKSDYVKEADLQLGK